ncbi:MAG: LuxR C-terminal-related transcriptional regulator [Marinoscillum sp.]
MLLKRLSPAFLLLFLVTISAFGQPRSFIQQLLDDGEYEKARLLCDSALSDPFQKANRAYYLSKRGDVYYFLGDLRESLRSYLQALEQSEINLPENRILKEETTSYTGFAYRELGLDQKAIQYFESALGQAFDIGDSIEIAICYYNISTVLLNQGALDESMEMLQNAYEIDLIRKDTAALGFDLTMMGAAMMKSTQPEKALDYYRESIDLLKAGKANYNSLGKRYGLLAEAFLAMNQLDSAEFYTQEAIEVHELQSDSLHIGQLWVQLAKIKNQANEPRNALQWGEQAKSLFQKYPLSSNALYANTSMIESYEAMTQWHKALILLKENEVYAKDLGLLYELRDTYKGMAEIYQQIRDSGAVIGALQAAQIMSDSINQLETERATENMKIRYDTEKIESENKVLTLENEVTKAHLAEREAEIQNLILIGCILLVIGIAILVIVIIRSRYKTRLLQMEVNELRVRIKGILEFKPEEVGIVKEHINNSLEETLSDREFEILNLALSNKNNGQIADEVHVSINTVKYHLKNIYTKLGVSNRKEALKYAVQIASN